MSTSKLQTEKMERTGVGLGGSGGVQAGQVEKSVFQDRGHMVPFEEVAACAEVMVEWLSRQLRAFKADDDFLKNHQSAKSERGMLVVSKKWMKLVREPSTAPRSAREKL